MARQAESSILMLMTTICVPRDAVGQLNVATHLKVHTTFMPHLSLFGRLFFTVLDSAYVYCFISRAYVSPRNRARHAGRTRQRTAATRKLVRLESGADRACLLVAGRAGAGGSPPPLKEILRSTLVRLPRESATKKSDC